MASQVWVVDICNFIIEQGMLYNMRHQSVQESWVVPGKTKPTLLSQLSNCLFNHTHLMGLPCLDKGIALIRGKPGEVNQVMTTVHRAQPYVDLLMSNSNKIIVKH